MEKMNNTPSNKSSSLYNYLTQHQYMKYQHINVFFAQFTDKIIPILKQIGMQYIHDQRLSCTVSPDITGEPMKIIISWTITISTSNEYQIGQTKIQINTPEELSVDGMFLLSSDILIQPDDLTSYMIFNHNITKELKNLCYGLWEFTIKQMMQKSNETFPFKPQESDVNINLKKDTTISPPKQQSSSIVKMKQQNQPISKPKPEKKTNDIMDDLDDFDFDVPDPPSLNAEKMIESKKPI